MGSRKTPSAPAPTDPMKEAQAQIAIKEAEARLQRETAAQEAARKAAEDGNRQKLFNENLDRSYNTAYDSSRQAIQDRGLDPTSYDQALKAELNKIRGGISSTDTNPGAYFNTDVAGAILGRERDRNRATYTRAFDEFAPDNFAQSHVADTMDDSYISDILGSQYGEASTQLMRARERGTLSDIGYGYGQKNLDEQKATANAKAQSLGGGVLSGYRDQLREIATRGREQAGKWDVGQKFDPNSYKSQIETTTKGFGGKLEGDIRNTLGSTSFFNSNDLIQKAGKYQGVTGGPTTVNAPGNDISAALVKQKTEEEKKRGLGNVGVF
jgi:hypothetical protein